MNFGEKRQTAIANYREEVLNSSRFAADKEGLRFNTMRGVSLTAEEVLNEMEKEPPTTEGMSLVEIWARPKEEIDKIVREAASSR
jgi:hypothetical protein